MSSIYSPLINNMVWSYSRIESFNDCPYRFFMKYIFNSSESPQFYSSYGSFIHKIIEKYYRGEISKAEMPLMFLRDFNNEVKGNRPSDKIVVKYISDGIEYLNTFKEFPYNMIDVEKKVVFNLKGNPFIGFIDYLGEKDGDLVIIDNKSRALKPRSKRRTETLNDKEIDTMLRQLYLYSAAIKQEYGKFPKKLCFNCFRNGEFIEEPFVESAYEEAVEWACKSIEQIKEASEFYPMVEFFSCKYICGFSDDCCYWQGR